MDEAATVVLVDTIVDEADDPIAPLRMRLHGRQGFVRAGSGADDEHVAFEPIVASRATSSRGFQSGVINTTLIDPLTSVWRSRDTVKCRNRKGRI